MFPARQRLLPFLPFTICLHVVLAAEVSAVSIFVNVTGHPKNLVSWSTIQLGSSSRLYGGSINSCISFSTICFLAILLVPPPSFFVGARDFKQ